MVYSHKKNCSIISWDWFWQLSANLFSKVLIEDVVGLYQFGCPKEPTLSTVDSWIYRRLGRLAKLLRSKLSTSIITFINRRVPGTCSYFPFQRECNLEFVKVSILLPHSSIFWSISMKLALLSDDTIFYFPHKNLLIIHNILQVYISNLDKYLNSWGFQITPLNTRHFWKEHQKSSFISFSWRQPHSVS